MRSVFVLLQISVFLLSQLFIAFLPIDVLLNDSTTDCGVLLLIFHHFQDLDSTCKSSGLLTVWTVLFYLVTCVATMILPLLYYIYESKDSPLFSSSISRWVVSGLLILGGAGITAVFSLLIRVLENHSKLKVVLMFFANEQISFVYSVPSAVTLISWILFLLYAPFGMVKLNYNLIVYLCLLLIHIQTLH